MAMNVVRSVGQKITYHGRAFLRLSGGVGFALTIYGTAMWVYTERRWRAGNSRIYDPPNWRGYSNEEKDEIIAKREGFVNTIKAFYELSEEANNDPTLVDLFMKDCILEDPKNRFVGRHEIIRALSLLRKEISSMHFVTYDPTHYEKKIVIKCFREFELHMKPIYFHQDPKITLRSNLVIHLIKDENGQEKMHYIVDEWNYVSLLQPQTHNVFCFAGTAAKFSRRFSAIMFYIYSKDGKSILNPFILFDVKDKVFNFLNERYQGSPKDDAKDSNEENAPVFNAGQLRNRE